jgi:hypothetical protein
VLTARASRGGKGLDQPSRVLQRGRAGNACTLNDQLLQTAAPTQLVIATLQPNPELASVVNVYPDETCERC